MVMSVRGPIPWILNWPDISQVQMGDQMTNLHFYTDPPHHLIVGSPITIELWWRWKRWRERETMMRRRRRPGLCGCWRQTMTLRGRSDHHQLVQMLSLRSLLLNIHILRRTERRHSTKARSHRERVDRDKKQRLERILYKWFLEEDKPAGKSGT